MKAKFVYESIKDVLKGPSEESILKSMENTDPDELLKKSARNGFIEGVKVALKKGADFHAKDDYALRWAANKGHTEIVKLLKKYMKNES